MKEPEFRSKPPDPKNMKINFDQFHPIRDHWPWQCGDLYGGWRTHVEYAWDFYWRDQLRSWTFCKVGLHKSVQWWCGDATWMACRCCGKRMSQPQSE